MHVCGRRSPHLNECLRNLINGIREKLIKGIPELEVPSFSPVYVKNVVLADRPNFKARADNVKIYGFENFNLEDINIDLDKRILIMIVSVDHIRIEADYDINAKILIPVAGHGPVEMKTDNLRANLTSRYKMVERNGKNYMFFYSITSKVYIKDYEIDFKPIGDTDKTLTTAINTALTDSKAEILANTTPNIEKTVSEVLLEISNNICKHFSYDELFPDRE